jgi:DNA-binding CsgD family transcriptional regulator
MKPTPITRVVNLCSGAGIRKAAGAPTRFTAEDTERESRKLKLTPRELEVLALLCEGLSNKLICRRLNICTGTVKCHVASILAALGVSSRLQAVVAAHRLGLLETQSRRTDDAAADAAEDFGPAVRRPHLVGGMSLNA